MKETHIATYENKLLGSLEAAADFQSELKQFMAQQGFRTGPTDKSLVEKNIDVYFQSTGKNDLTRTYQFLFGAFQNCFTFVANEKDIVIPTLKTIESFSKNFSGLEYVAVTEPSFQAKRKLFTSNSIANVPPGIEDGMHNL